jgi:hypothetical protein
LLGFPSDAGSVLFEVRRTRVSLIRQALGAPLQKSAIAARHIGAAAIQGCISTAY